MIGFDAIPGQQQAKRLLRNVLLRGKVSHAYIFHGPRGTGKKAAALAFARALFCQTGKDEGCGECAECRKVESGNHTGLVFVAPEGASVKIGQIRELKRRFQYRSSSGTPAQVYVIEEAEKMTAQAANSLLKFLEEPGAPVIALLLTENGHALLPTIRSRAQWIPFVPLPPAEMAAVLAAEGLPEPLVRAAVHLAPGPEAARGLASSGWFAEIRDVVIQLAKECSADVHAAMLTAQRRLAGTELAEHLETLFDLFALWFRDIVRLQWNRKDALVFADQLEELSKQARRRPGAEWADCIKLAMDARRRLRAHANAQLVVDHFLLSLERR